MKVVEYRGVILSALRAEPGLYSNLIQERLTDHWRWTTFLGRKCKPGSVWEILLGPSGGQMWVTLAKLEEEGLIRSQLINPDGPFPRKRAYYLVREKDDPPEAIALALRHAFPNFQNDRPITADLIRSIGRGYGRMVANWGPSKTELDFVDQEGVTRMLTYFEGDPPDVSGGWGVPDDAKWKIVDLTERPEDRKDG